MSSRSNSVKAVKKSIPQSLFLVEFAAHCANVGVTPNCYESYEVAVVLDIVCFFTNLTYYSYFQIIIDPPELKK